MTRSPVDCPHCGRQVPENAQTDTCPGCGHLIRRCAGCATLLPAHPQERCPNPACRARALYIPLSGGQPIRVLHLYAEVVHDGVTYRVEGILRQPNDGTTIYRVRAAAEKAFRRRYREAPPRDAQGHALALKETVLECRGTPAGSGTPREEFEAVMARVAGLRHPGIVRTYCGWEEAGRRCVLMRAVSGPSIQEEFLGAAQPGEGAPVDDLRRAARGLGDAVDYLHREGIWHRDITPANVVWEAERPVIVDFGSAVLAGDGGGRAPLTHRYAPLELYADSGLKADGRADQYLLGSLLFCMAWGVPADHYLQGLGLHALPLAPERRQALERDEADPQRPITRYRPDVPRPLAAAIHRLLALDPRDRFTDGEPLRRALSARGAGLRLPLGGWAGRLLALAVLAGSAWMGVTLSPGVRAEMGLREAARLAARGEADGARTARVQAQAHIADGVPWLWRGRLEAARSAYGRACLDAGWQALNRGRSCDGARLAREALFMLGAGNSASGTELLRRCRTLCPEERDE